MNWYQKKFGRSSWELFFEQKMRTIFTEKHSILDIGGGLRLDPGRNNRRREHRWLDPYLSTVNYQVLDKVPDYHPDLVGDIHHLPLPDASIEAILCINVLEHVEDPAQAIKEIWRVLKPGGYLYVEVPFLLYYHPLPGYYQDFFRFTQDGLRYLLRNFKTIELENVRGALATVMNLFPIFSKRTRWFEMIDRILGKDRSAQTCGYRVFCVK